MGKNAARRREWKNKEQETNNEDHAHESQERDWGIKVGWVAAKKGMFNLIKHPFFMATLMIIMGGIFSTAMMIPGLGGFLGIWMMVVLMIGVSKSALAFEHQENPLLFCVNKFRQSFQKNMVWSVMALMLMLIMLILVALLNQMFVAPMVTSENSFLTVFKNNTVLLLGLNLIGVLYFYILWVLGVAACGSILFQGTAVRTYLRSVLFWVTKWGHFIGFILFWLIFDFALTIAIILMFTQMIAKTFPMSMLTMLILTQVIVACFTITGVAVGWGYLEMEYEAVPEDKNGVNDQDNALIH